MNQQTQLGLMPSTQPSGFTPGRRTSLPVLVALLVTATLTLYAGTLLRPMLLQDDFQILAQSWTAQRTLENLWEPQNEHIMPPGRVLTGLLVTLAGRAGLVPAVVSWVGPLGVLVALGLLYLLVVGETGRPFDGLIACTLFGVSSSYQQAVFWFAASFSVVMLDTLLLALLACQRWRRTGRVLYLDLTVLACALAPAWFASGALAGPLCCLYLLVPDSDREPQGSFLPRSFSLLPLAGTALFLALALPRAADKINHLEHYSGRTAVESFSPMVGLVYTARSVIDNLVLGLVGLRDVAVPIPLVIVAWVVLIGLGVWWWRSARHPRCLVLGFGIILTSYWLTYSARGTWEYEGQMTGMAWSRYHLLPQLGLALFVAGGLERTTSPFGPTVALTRKQVWVVAGLIVLCLVVQLPRGLLAYFPANENLDLLLRRIDAVDERCRRHHISAAQAREALPKLDLGEWVSQVNGWEFLRGSDAPQPHSAEEVRALLEE
jgi:hypothetical protein